MNIINKFIHWWAVRKFGYLILFISILIGFFGYLSLHGFILGAIKLNLVQDFYANFSTELFSLAVTILIVDFLYEKRATEQEKKRLILQMGSPDNAFAIEAIRQLRVKGWLFDGSIVGADLSHANLHRADLSYANLRNTVLYRANLAETSLLYADFEDAFLNGVDLSNADLSVVNFKNAKLNNAVFKDARISNVDFSNAQIKFSNFNNSRIWVNDLPFLNTDPLLVADSLRGTILHNNKRYLGQYNLLGDINDAKTNYNVDITNNKAMKKYYQVSHEEKHILIQSEIHNRWVDKRKSK